VSPGGEKRHQYHLAKKKNNKDRRKEKRKEGLGQAACKREKGKLCRTAKRKKLEKLRFQSKRKKGIPTSLQREGGCRPG